MINILLPNEPKHFLFEFDFELYLPSLWPIIEHTPCSFIVPSFALHQDLKARLQPTTNNSKHYTIILSYYPAIILVYYFKMSKILPFLVFKVQLDSNIRCFFISVHWKKLIWDSLGLWVECHLYSFLFVFCN